MLRRLPECGLRAMKVELALPPSKRDLRLDLFRGLANWLMFLGHVSTSVLAWFSFRNYGFSDGADLFVFISGYTSALVFGRRMLEGGFVFGTTQAAAARVADLRRPHPAVRVLSGFRPFPLKQLQRARPHRPVQCRPAAERAGRNHHAGAVAPIQAAEPRRAAALRRPDGRLSAGALADAQAPQLGDAGIRIALFRRPAIRLEPALLSVGRLVFQPVRVAASFRAWRMAGAGRRQYAAFPGALQGRSSWSGWPICSLPPS